MKTDAKCTKMHSRVATECVVLVSATSYIHERGFLPWHLLRLSTPFVNATLHSRVFLCCCTHEQSKMPWDLSGQNVSLVSTGRCSRERGRTLPHLNLLLNLVTCIDVVCCVKILYWFFFTTGGNGRVELFEDISTLRWHHYHT